MRWTLAKVLTVAVLSLVGVARADDPKSFRIGAIDFFGAHGTDTAAIRKKMSVRGGQVIPLERMDQALESIRSEVMAATGMKVTDVEVLCCDVPGIFDLYVGLAGSSYRASTYAPAPAGDVMLPAEEMALYKQDLDLLQEAIEKGQAAEDDSKGYALMAYPPSRKVQLAMRAYAVGHEAELEQVLGAAKDAKHREASAMLLGYGERSEKQVAALEAATNDESAEVRNNALRALEVMLVAGPVPALSVKPLIALLYSGTWSDRNKVSLLLDRMTVTRDPALLVPLRGAVGPLEDGARWHSPGHARPFLDVLGRMGGIEEKKLQELEDKGAQDEIIAAAEKP